MDLPEIKRLNRRDTQEEILSFTSVVFNLNSTMEYQMLIQKL